MDIWESRVGIIRYDANNDSDPYTPPVEKQHYGYGCNDPATTNLVPIVERQVGPPVNPQTQAQYLEIGLQTYPNVSNSTSGITRWVFANTSLYLNWEDPTIKKLTLDSSPNFTAETSPIFLDYETGDWVYFVITNNYSFSTTNTPRTDPQSVHPIHLHGHDFVILAQGEGPFTTDIVPNLNNPTRRDVADCTIGGYVWIAFQVDNPGAWLMHCHIAWHASAGLGIQFIEQPSKIKGLYEDAGVMPEFAERCKDWTEFYTDYNIPANALQDDSAI